ncbi:MAG: amidohydrolase, partial [Gemmatimonadetes bacterium]|nr:amidohydrolase [Gemmatimonadota bacterium]
RYQPIIRPEDRPATWLNADIRGKHRPEMRKYYYDAAKYQNYLEQLGVAYPTVRQADGSCGGGAVP